MKKKRSLLMFMVMGVVLITFGAGMVSAEQVITITGTINDEGQIVVNEKTSYNVGDTAKGEEMLEKVEADDRVQVTGDVEEEDGEKIIHVISYKVLEKRT